jgi:NAD(P)H-dependent flavin oxidoreductase YrpB (nitropropane dioxygenase family)
VIHTPVCDLLGIRHPIALGGMAGSTSVPLVAAVSNAGGLGTLGLGGGIGLSAEQISQDIAAIRATTENSFGVNFLLFRAREPAIDAALDARPPVFAAAWARPDQDLKALFGRAHEAGSRVMYQAPTVPEALRAKEAGADVIVAQGTEGGGHVGWMASMALLPMIVDAVGPTPVLAAGGIADGRGLAPRWRSAHKASCWVRASWPHRNRRCTPASSRRCLTATGTTRS